MTTNSPLDERLLELIRFHVGKFGRPLTILELIRGVGDTKPLVILDALDTLTGRRELICENGFYAIPGSAAIAATRASQDFQYDQKWRRLLRLVSILRHTPFVEAAFASGSLAIGNVTPASDFDILIVVRPGRMFLTRYALITLSILLSAHRPNDNPAEKSDKLCLNHYVTRETWSKPPYNEYRTELYRSLVPLWGDSTIVSAFIAANSWCGRTEWLSDDFRWQDDKRSVSRSILEWVLHGIVGDFIERKVVRPIAMRRLTRYTKRPEGGRGRIVVSDAELEFHRPLPYESV